jgi:hypothetical protein
MGVENIMSDEHPEYDPKALWQQESEHARLSMEEIVARSEELKRKNRRDMATFSVALLLYAAISITEDISNIEGNLWWVGAIRFALLIVWVYYLPVGFAGTNYLSPIQLQTSGMTPSFEFYRKQLERRRDYFGDGYRTGLQWAFLTLGIVLFSIAYPPLFLLFGIPLAITAAVVFIRKKREMPHIQREIETLNRLTKQ